MNSSITLIIPNSQTKTSGINAPMSPDEESTEDGLSEEVKNTVEDGLGVRRDEVATLTDTPCNRVQKP